MGLDGCFAGSDRIGYLFVQETRNDPRKQFSFTRCQRFKALPQLCNFGFLCTSGKVSLQPLLNCIEQLLVTEWLGEEFNRSRLHSPHGHGNVAMGTDENDGNVNVGFSQFALKIKSTDARQPYIEYQATRYIRTLASQELPCGTKSLDSQPYGLDQPLDGSTNGWIVIHDKNNRCYVGHQDTITIGAVR